MASSLPQLRRDLTDSTQVGPWHCARERLVSRAARLGRWPCLLRRELAALAQLEIEFSDGHVQTIVTDRELDGGAVGGDIE